MVKRSKKRKGKKRPLTLQEWLFRLFVAAILIFLTWLFEEWPTTSFPSSEKPVAIYAKEDNDDLRHLFLSAIQQAEKSMVLVMYTLRDPAVINAIRKKAEQGISTYLVLDKKEIDDTKEKLGNRVNIQERSSPGILHQKMLVIDDKVAWIGSANFTYGSLRKYGNLVFGIESPPLADYITLKAKSLTPKGRAPPVEERTFLFGEQKGEIYFLPDDRAAVDKVKKCLRTAEKTIRVAMFTFTREDLAEELVAAKRRGVDTQVVVDRHQGSNTGKEIVDYLRQCGVPTGFSQGNDLLHHKFCYIDGKTLINGSANWTKAAFQTNDDFFMILYPLNEEQRNKMDRVWRVIKEESDL